MPARSLSRPALVLALLLPSCGSGGAGSVDARQVFPDPKTAALAEAAADGDGERVRELIQAGADPNARGDKGVNLLQWALLNKSKDGLEALLSAGADPSRADESGATVVHYAAMANDPAYLNILLAHRADPNTPNAVTRATPLMSALLGDRDAQFHKLLAAGADPNLTDRMGNTSLHLAAKINHAKQVLELLEAGADPAARNHQGASFQLYLNMTPPEVLSEDARRGREAIAAWLREHRVPVDEAPAR